MIAVLKFSDESCFTRVAVASCSANGSERATPPNASATVVNFHGPILSWSVNTIVESRCENGTISVTPRDRNSASVANAQPGWVVSTSGPFAPGPGGGLGARRLLGATAEHPSWSDLGVHPVQHDRLTSDQHVGYPGGELVRILECCPVYDRSRVEDGHVCYKAF